MSLRPLARGSALGLATVVVEKGAALVLVVGLARLLGVEDYGRYSFIIAYLTLFQVLADLGLEPILLRRLSQEPADRSRVLANALGMRISLAFLSAGLAVVLVGWAAPDQAGLTPFVAVGAAGLLFVGQPGFRALWRAEARMGRVLTVATLTNLALLVLVGIALWAGTGLLGVFLGITAAHLGGFVLAAVLARSTFRFRVAFEMDLWRELFSQAWPVGANVFAVMLGLRIGPVLLLSYGGAVEVGYLASSMRLVEALNLIAEGLMLAVFPVLARLAREDAAALARLAGICARIQAFLLLAVVLFLSQLSPEVLSLLFGPEFAVAAPALRVLSWFALLASLGTLYTNMLVALGHQRVLFVLNAVSAVFQVGLQFFLVSRYGLMGAAVGVLLANAINHGVLCVLPSTGPWVRPCVRAVLPAVFLALGLSFAGWFLAGPPLPQAVGLVVAFSILALFLYRSGFSDLRELRNALGPAAGS